MLKVLMIILQIQDNFMFCIIYIKILIKFMDISQIQVIEKRMATLFVKLLHPDAVFPSLATASSAGLDLYAISNHEIPPNCVEKVPTGLGMEIPAGYFGKIFDRSSLALRQIFCVSGVIDNDYRGEVVVILRNASLETFVIQKGDKIAQMICIPYLRNNVIETVMLSQTQRGDKGFGSSGK